MIRQLWRCRAGGPGRTVVAGLACLSVAACGELTIGRQLEGTPAVSDSGPPIRRATATDAPHPNLASVPERPADLPDGAAVRDRIATLQREQAEGAAARERLTGREPQATDPGNGNAGAAPVIGGPRVFPDGVPPDAPDLGTLSPPAPPRRPQLPALEDGIGPAPVQVPPESAAVERSAPPQPRADAPASAPAPAPPALPPPAQIEAPTPRVDTVERVGPPAFLSPVPTQVSAAARLLTSQTTRSRLPSVRQPPPGQPGALALLSSTAPVERPLGPQTGPRPVAEFVQRSPGFTELMATITFDPGVAAPSDADAQVLGPAARAQFHLAGALRVLAVAPQDADPPAQILARQRAQAVAAMLIRLGADAGDVYVGVATDGSSRGDRAEIYLDY